MLGPMEESLRANLQAASPAWNAEPCADQGEDEVPAYECARCIEVGNIACWSYVHLCVPSSAFAAGVVQS